MTLTPQEQYMLTYLQSVYPTGIRGKINDEDSLVYKYDVVRVNTILQSILQRQQGVNNLFVLTSDSYGVQEREEFLKLPVDPGMSLEARKARLVVRLSGGSATIADLRSVIETFIGTGVYEIVELWKETPFVADDTWTYMVDLYDPQPTWAISEMVSILTSAQPAHCLLVMAYTHPVKDAVGIGGVLAGALHDPFIWADPSNPAPTDAIRGSNAIPLVGGYWS